MSLQFTFVIGGNTVFNFSLPYSLDLRQGRVLKRFQKHLSEARALIRRQHACLLFDFDKGYGHIHYSEALIKAFYTRAGHLASLPCPLTRLMVY